MGWVQRTAASPTAHYVARQDGLCDGLDMPVPGLQRGRSREKETCIGGGRFGVPGARLTLKVLCVVAVKFTRSISLTEREKGIGIHKCDRTGDLG